MKIDVIFEMAEDGGFSCYMSQDHPQVALSGYGDTPQQAKEDMLEAYNEINALRISKGEKPLDFDFVYHYDV